MDAAVEMHRFAIHHRRQFFQKIDGGEVEHGMNGVEAQGVNMKVAQKIDSVLNKVAAHLVATRAIKVDGIAPGRVIAVGEIGAIVPQIIALGPQMVIDHIQDNGDARLVTGVDEAFEAKMTAIGILHGEGGHTVIAPVAFAGELGHGHEFDGGDAKFFEPIQVRNDGVKGAFGRESTDMKLVDDEMLQGQPGPGVIFPGKMGVNQLAGAMYPFGLYRARWGRVDP